MSGLIYEPEEDSFLMADFLEKQIPVMLEMNPNLKIFEMGSGSGINLKRLFGAGVNEKNIFSCDINSDAVKFCKNLGFNCVKSNLFEKTAKKRKYDVIIFNPPYLPEDKKEPPDSRIATTGGLKGNELIIEFLNQAKNYLNKNGIIFLITSSLSEGINFEERGYNAREISRKFMFYEKLFLWGLTFDV